MTPDLPELLRFAVQTAREAGRVIAQHDQLVPLTAPRMKGLRDPVTEADVAAERVIVQRLREHPLRAAIYAEEEVREGSTDGLTWYVDPLDGTVNFSQCHPFFAVSLALYDGPRPLVGVVHAPRLDETFAAGRGLGTRFNGTPVRVSSKQVLADAVLATGFAYRRHELADNNVGHFNDFILGVRGIRRCGSAALDLAYTAAGRLDGYWEPHLNPFDVAAGALLVQEAAGVVSDMDGGEAWLAGGSIAAGNATLHARILQVLAGAAP